MTQKEKLIEKLLNRPTSLRYNEIESLFKNDNFIIKKWKWSHKIIVFKANQRHFVTIAIHNNDCKKHYKEDLRDLYKFYLFNK